MDFGDKSRGFASGEKQKEEPHHLDWPDSQSAEVVDIRRAGDAQGHREPGDERVVGKIPEEGRGGPTHAEPALEQPKQPGISANDGAHPPVKNETEESTDDPEGHLPSAHDLDQPGKAKALKGFALVGQRGCRHAGEGGIVAPETDSVTRVGNFTENALPEAARGGAELVPKGFQMPEGGGDVGPARAATLSGLMRGEHGLNDGTNDVHEGPKILRRVMSNWKGR